MCAHVHNHLLLRCCSCEEEKHIVHHLYSLHLSLRDQLVPVLSGGAPLPKQKHQNVTKSSVRTSTIIRLGPLWVI